MRLRTSLDHLRDVAGEIDDEALDEVLENLEVGVDYASRLREAILTEHRERHAEVDPRWCSEPCRMAASA